MRILLVGDSNDARDWFAGGKKRHEIVAERLETEYGEPVEMTVKSLWPDDRATGMLTRWIDQTEPDVIYLAAVSFWFQYRSVPLRVKRLLGPLGARFAAVGFRAADSPRWSYNAVFRGIRRGLQRTIGGDTHFTTDAVIACMDQCVRLAARREGAVLIVKGPHSRANHAVSKRTRVENEEKRLRVNDALAALCGQLHIAYHGSDRAVFDDPEFRVKRAGDGMHASAIRHITDAEVLYVSIRDALEAAGRTPPTASPHERSSYASAAPVLPLSPRA